MSKHPSPNHPDPIRQGTLRVLTSAINFPGRVFPLPLAGISTVTAFTLIGDALLDDASTFYTPDDGLNVYLGRSDAAQVDATAAGHHFYLQLGTEELQTVEAASEVNAASLTTRVKLFVDCKLGDGTTLQLSGPGISQPDTLQVNRLPERFWVLRQQAIERGLPWDMYLVAGSNVVGLPRTITVNVLKTQ